MGEHGRAEKEMILLQVKDINSGRGAGRSSTSMRFPR